MYLKINTTFQTECDIISLLSKHSKELHIESTCESNSLSASYEFPHCPILTSLTFEGLHIDESVPSVMRRSSGQLPCLRHVTLMDCCPMASILDWPDENELSVIIKRVGGWKCTICSNRYEI